MEQFHATLALERAAGRKLEFLTQEMFRETNTIGSKANDVTIARHVIEIKAAIERIREMIQNVEVAHQSRSEAACASVEGPSGGRQPDLASGL